MSDPLRDDPAGALSGEALVDRDTKIEELLLAGLDHYFANEYEQAINVWTRVLFLDRSHARARAYIERARGAQAERHRELEELLQRGLAALNRGEAGTARDLLTSAVARGGPHDEALALLQRLDRLEAATTRPGTPAAGAARVRARRQRPLDARVAERRRRSWLLPLLLVFAIAVAATVVTVGWEDLDAFITLPHTSRAASAFQPRDEPLPVPTTSDVAMARARFFFDRGHLREALHALDAVRPGSRAKADADALRITIQRALLEGADPRAGRVAAPPPGAPTNR